jgi:DNA-binding NarL/FixJ family response regulator
LLTRFNDDLVVRPIRILFVEGQPVLARRLAELRTDYSDLEVVGAATSIREATSLASATQPDVALIDQQLSDGYGSNLCDWLHVRLPQIAVIILASDSLDETLLRAVESGAIGVISKTAAAEDVVEAILRASEDEFLLSRSVVTRLFRRGRELRRRQASGGSHEAPH